MDQYNLSDQELYELAQKRVMAKRGFRIHLGVYIMVCLLLAFISLSNGQMWFVYPVLGWGIGVVSHGISVTSIISARDEIEREFNALKNSKK